VKTAILAIKPNSSLVSGLIPLKIFKWCFLAFTTPLASIFTEILNTAEIPGFLKIASVIPLYKGKGTTTNPDNYRPISLLSPMAKIFEVVLFNKLRPLIESRLCPQQHGFRRNRSTHTAISVFSQEVWDSLDQTNGRVGAVYIHLSKAFNSVQSEILLHKLAFRFNLPVQLVKVIRSFLSSRTFNIRIGNFISKS